MSILGSSISPALFLPPAWSSSLGKMLSARKSLNWERWLSQNDKFWTGWWRAKVLMSWGAELLKFYHYFYTFHPLCFSNFIILFTYRFSDFRSFINMSFYRLLEKEKNSFCQFLNACDFQILILLNDEVKLHIIVNSQIYASCKVRHFMFLGQME